ncbi:N-formyl peptide receptor 3-like [Lissotriton helveticus]
MESSPEVLELLCRYLWNLRNFSKSDILKQRTGIHEGIWFTSVILSTVTCAIGLFGNGLVIWLTAFRMKNVKSNLWFLNLAVADFGFLLCLPLWLTSLFLEKWPFGTFLCKTHHFVSTVNMYASIFILTALSIDRCISVVLPLWHREHASRHLYFYICTALWIITVVLSVPILLHSKVTQHPDGQQCDLAFYGEEMFNANNLLINSSKCRTEITISSTLDMSNLSESNKDHLSSFYLEVTTEDRNYSAFEGKIHGNKSDGILVVEDIFSIVQTVFTSLVSSNAELIFPELPFNQQDCQNDDWQKSLQNCTNASEAVKWHQMLSSMEIILIPLLVIGIFVPLAIIVSSNILVIFKVQESQSGKAGRFTRLYVVILTMVAAYFLSWMPMTVAQIMIMKAAQQMDLQQMHSLISVMPLVSCIASFNSCLNPILYVLIGQKVKDKLKESLTSMWQSITDNSQSQLQRDQAN